MMAYQQKRPARFAVQIALTALYFGSTRDVRAEPPPAPDGKQWAPIPELSDEFDAASIDISKWKIGRPASGWPGRPPSRFEADNVSASSGTLELRATALVRVLDQVRDPKKDIWIGAACLSSIRPIARFGYYEARVKISQLAMSSSFWFQGHYSEIDVTESFGDTEAEDAQPAYRMHSNTHYFPFGWKKDENTPALIYSPSALTGWHEYGAWWIDEHTVWFYLDGVKVSEQTTKGAFDEPMYMYFDTEPFVWQGFPSLEALRDPQKNVMRVDWVRSYRLVPKLPSTNGTPY